MKKINIFLSLITTLIISNNARAENTKSLSAGDSVSSTSSETNEITDKIRRQIEELNKGILHGAPQFSMVGKFQKAGDEYIINGDSFLVDKDTIIHGELKPDSYIEVRGNLVKGKPKIAKQITVANPSTEPLLKGSEGSGVSSFLASENR